MGSDRQPLPVTAVILAKDEERAIGRCVEAASFVEQVLVIVSPSVDRTRMKAEAAGAEVLDFHWNGRYPKKKQWSMAHPAVRHDWVLHLDADEIVTTKLAREITGALGASRDANIAAYEIPVSYHFMGKKLRFGHRVYKRSLVDKTRVSFPEVGDLQAPGITEVEGHYQPSVHRGEVARLKSLLTHDDPDPLSDWIARHNRYSDWEAYLRRNHEIRSGIRASRSRGGRLFERIPAKPATFFLYSYIARLGFLDGRPGLDYALSLAWYYWTIDAKARDASRAVPEE